MALVSVPGGGGGSSMPHRRFSAMILGGLWPTTSSEEWWDAADGLLAKSKSLEGNAVSIRQGAAGLIAENSGKTIDAMYDMCVRQATAVRHWGDVHRTMSECVSGIGREIHSARVKLDAIDEEANEEIERIEKAAAAQVRLGAGVFSGAAMHAEINAVIAQAKEAAGAASAAAVGQIEGLSARMTALDRAAPTATSNGQSPLNDPELQKYFGMGGGAGPGLHGGLQNLPQEGGGGGTRPPASDLTGNAEPPTEPSRLAADDDTRTGQSDTGGTDLLNGDGRKHPSAGELQGTNQPGGSPPDGPATVGSPPMMPPMGTPSTGSGGSGVGGLWGLGGSRGLGSLSPASGLSSGVPSAPSTPAMGSALGGPASGGMPSVPSGGGGGGGMPPAASGSDFTRGFNAGFATGPAGTSVLPPPVSAPPSTSAAAANSLPSAPAPSPAPAAGGGAASGGAGMPMGAAPMMAAGAAAAPAGALPPFGSDMQTRQVAPAAGAAPAAPPPPAAPPAASAGAIPPLPSGVAPSGVGAAAAGAYAGVKSSSDPLLESATQLVYQLAHASRTYASVDWCVGVFKTPDGRDIVVVSSEGAGYIPPGVFPPRSVRMLFSDTGLTAEFRRRWFGWANPAQTMLAYASLMCDNDPNRELYALAVSTDHGGSAVPARDAGVPYYEDCPLISSPIAEMAPAMPLDEWHMHRLQATDAAEYARLMRAAIPESQERDIAWGTTHEAVRTALDRVGSLLGLEVAPVIRHVFRALNDGDLVSDEDWRDLEFARVKASIDASSLRAGWNSNDGEATPLARACENLARVATLLLMWRGGPKHPEIAYEARQIMKEAELWPTPT